MPLNGSRQIASTWDVKKIKWSLLGTYQKLGKATEINITVNDEQLERIDEYKYLRMIFDKNLNWHNHIDKMCAKISQWLELLQRITFCILNVTLRMLYNTLVLPLFNYAILPIELLIRHIWNSYRFYKTRVPVCF